MSLATPVRTSVPLLSPDTATVRPPIGTLACVPLPPMPSWPPGTLSVTVTGRPKASDSGSATTMASAGPMRVGWSSKVVAEVPPSSVAASFTLEARTATLAAAMLPASAPVVGTAALYQSGSVASMAAGLPPGVCGWFAAPPLAPPASAPLPSRRRSSAMTCT
ncbi:Uncharacterised protein [Xylophilus ampelinus]|nr:Uncharacterised protein [Xylophilus ampelinus]